MWRTTRTVVVVVVWRGGGWMGILYGWIDHKTDVK